MTKKDFILIAATLANRRSFAINEEVASKEARVFELELVARDFADALQQSNPRFDRARFLAACVKA
ncbi:MAG: hypothetical protein RB191_02165 [Terriglobia bacterium]|nr:hypothetical protein [Terriglobia bacterium]